MLHKSEHFSAISPWKDIVLLGHSASLRTRNGISTILSLGSPYMHPTTSFPAENGSRDCVPVSLVSVTCNSSSVCSWASLYLLYAEALAMILGNVYWFARTACSLQETPAVVSGRTVSGASPWPHCVWLGAHSFNPLRPDGAHLGHWVKAPPSSFSSVNYSGPVGSRCILHGEVI